MQTARKKTNRLAMALLVSGVFVGGLAGQSPVAWAQTAVAQPPAAAPVSAAPAVVAPPAADAAPATPSADTVPKAAVDTAAAALPEKNTGEVKTVSAAAEKLSDAANALAKRLSAKENMTLDDLNATRQTITKIEALIELEKRLNELDKIRSERDEASGSLAEAIPSSALRSHKGGNQQLPDPIASALPLPMPIAASPVSIPEVHLVSLPSFSNIEVSRVIGVDGHFSAIVKSNGGPPKTVQVGDQVDGATVTAITSAGVELTQDKTKRTLPVKNVQTVFSNSP